ncbi:hypothetical protein GCM10009678_43220 [Actinomadura kijaniata]|uniref:Uncharacterized protein n=1 Tax=Actinomadura namibiensis TaxID=182080 RepID=A0A7W3LU17_ACTNM|nr:hypothetical protein [Actinomadura namibiensis]
MRTRTLAAAGAVAALVALPAALPGCRPSGPPMRLDVHLDRPAVTVPAERVRELRKRIERDGRIRGTKQLTPLPKVGLISLAWSSDPHG